MEDLDARSLSSAAQEDLRRRVVRAVTEEEVSPSAAARLFGVSRQAVYGWLRRYRRHGEAGLVAGQRGRPAQPLRLSAAQARQVQRWIRDRCPDQLKLPLALWTRAAVQQLIARRLEVRLSVWTVGRYLQRWGMTPQKPLRRAYERDPVAVARWLAEEYPQLRAQARQAGATLWWGDEMGLRSDHQAGRSYGLRDHTPVVPGTGQRFRCNMISALTNRGHLCFRLFENTLTAPLFLDFLGRLHRYRDRPVFLVVDRHPVHRAAKVRRWLAQHPEQVRLFFLPAYSPELNPDELVNQDVKTNVVGRQRPHDQAEMMSQVRSYLRWVQRYFHAPPVHYAAS